MARHPRRAIAASAADPMPPNPTTTTVGVITTPEPTTHHDAGTGTKKGVLAIEMIAKTPDERVC